MHWIEQDSLSRLVSPNQVDSRPKGLALGGSRWKSSFWVVFVTLFGATACSCSPWLEHFQLGLLGGGDFCHRAGGGDADEVV